MFKDAYNYFTLSGWSTPTSSLLDVLHIDLIAFKVGEAEEKQLWNGARYD